MEHSSIVPENVKATVSFYSFKNSLSDFLALIQLVQFLGRPFACEVVRNVMAFPPTRINSTKVTKVSNQQYNVLKSKREEIVGVSCKR